VPKAETAHVASRLLSELPVADLTIEDPPIEEVIESVFASLGNPVEHNEPAPV
jgi:ABC-2 type transport system ATP-binding protein